MFKIIKDNQTCKGSFIIASVISILLAMLYINCMNYAMDHVHLLDKHSWRSLTIYLSGMVLFAATWLLIYVIQQPLLKSESIKKKITNICFGGGMLTLKYQIWVVVSLGLVNLFILCRYFYFKQIGEIGYNRGLLFNLPLAIWYSVAIATVVFIIAMIVKKRDIDSLAKYFFYSISLFVTFFTSLITNPFVDGDIPHGLQIGFLHFNLVGESIFNIVDGVAYSLDTTPLYGHYALFFLPLKLFTGESLIYAFLLEFALLACIEQIAFVYIIDKFSPKNYIAAALALGGTLRIVYWAAHLTPVRTLFPVLLFAFLVYLYSADKKIRSRFGYASSLILLTAAVLFNLEIGICCLVGVFSYVFFELAHERVKLSVFIKELTHTVLICLLAIALAIGIVNIYNLLCGGPLIFKEFFFPLIGGDTSIVKYIQDHFLWPVPLGMAAWEFILVFLLGAFCTACYCVVYGTEQKDKTIIPLLGGVACMELAAFSYYMNEPLWTDLVVYRHILYGLFAMVLGKIYLWLEKDEYPHISDQLIRGVSLFIIFVAALEAIQVINDPVRIAARSWFGAYDTTAMRSQVAEIDITEDVYGFGQGVNMIYHMKGLDNHMKYRDTTELDLPYYPTFEKVVNELKQKDKVFVNTTYDYDLRLLKKLEDEGFSFTPIREWQVGDFTYSYCSISYNK